jgi:hypothetical protein
METQEYVLRNIFILMHKKFQKYMKTHNKMNDGIMKINGKF